MQTTSRLAVALWLMKTALACAAEAPAPPSLDEIFRTAPQPISFLAANSAVKSGASNMVARPEVYLSAGNHGFTWLGLAGDEQLQLFGRQKSLRHVVVNNCPVTDDGVRDLAAGRTLNKVEVLSRVKLTDAALAGWDQCGELTELKIGPVEWTAEACKVLAALPKLQRLTIVHGKISAGGLAELGASKSLGLLALQGVDIGDAGLDRLASTNLSFLEVSACKLRPADVAAIAKLTSLSSLNVCQTNFGDADLTQLIGLEKLAGLSISTTPVTAGGLLALKKMPALRYITYDSLRITDAEARRLADAYGWTFGGACSCGCLDIEPQQSAK